MPFVSNISQNPMTNRLIENLINNDLFSNTCIFIERFNDKELEEILFREAFSYLEKHIYDCHPLTPAQKSCIVAALTLIALKCYDGDLHTHIENRFRKYCSNRGVFSKGIDIQKAVRFVLDSYKEKVHYFNPSSFIAVPLVLCCVPHSRVGDLFTIAYDIYKKKLLFDEDVNDEQINEKVAESLNALRKKDLVSDSDKIKGTTYLMSSFTQSCIYSGCGVELLAQIITRCIRLILDYLSRPKDSFFVDAFYIDGYEQWTRKFESNSAEKESYERKRTLSQPCFKLVGNSVHIVTGKYNMDDSYNPADVKICIYQRNIILQIVPLDGPNDIEYVDEEDPLSGYIINRKDIRIEGSPLDFLSYTIVCGDVEIYNSKARLNRKNLFFDGYGNEVKPGCDYIGYLSVVEHESNESEYGDRIKENPCGNYFLATIEVNNQDVFRFDNEPYVFFKVSSPKLISYEIPWAFFATREKTYPLYNDVIILFSASCSKEDIYIVVDDNIIYRSVEKPETDVRFNIRLFSKNHDENCAYTIKLFNLEAGYHNVKIFNSISKKQISGANFHIICDPKLKKTYVKNTNNGIQYDLTGNIVDNQQLIYEHGMFNKEIRAFAKGLGYGNLVIHPSSISYSIDNEKWFDINDFPYFCDIPEDIKYINICAPAKTKAFYIDAENVLKKMPLNLVKDDDCQTKYRLYLDYLRTRYEKKKAKLLFEFGAHHKIISIWYNPLVDKNECNFHYDEKRNVHIFKFVYNGESELKAKIMLAKSSNVIMESSIHNGDIIELPDSAIDAKVDFLSIALYGKKYGALFDAFDSEPFMTFPRYNLNRRIAKLTKRPILYYDDSKKKLICCFTFEGADFCKVVIKPSGFTQSIEEEIVEINQKLEFDFSENFFSSYNVLLYAQEDGQNKVFCQEPFFISKAIKVDSPLLKKKFKITYFILDDGKPLKTNYAIFFAKTGFIENTYCFVSKLIDENNGNVFDDVIIKVENKTIINNTVLRLTISVKRLSKGRLMDLKTTNGRIIRAVVAEKTRSLS